jgi:hypothetical protein
MKVKAGITVFSSSFGPRNSPQSAYGSWPTGGSCAPCGADRVLAGARCNFYKDDFQCGVFLAKAQLHVGPRAGVRSVNWPGCQPDQTV